MPASDFFLLKHTINFLMPIFDLLKIIFKKARNNSKEPKNSMMNALFGPENKSLDFDVKIVDLGNACWTVSQCLKNFEFKNIFCHIL